MSLPFSPLPSPRLSSPSLSVYVCANNGVYSYWSAENGIVTEVDPADEDAMDGVEAEDDD